VGYRFVVTEDATLSATSAPGGFVAISQSLIKVTKSEDELAAVLAHEISHIALKHSEENIKNRNRLELGKKIFEDFAGCGLFPGFSVSRDQSNPRFFHVLRESSAQRES
jgi:predicted Zn-dependent protease